MRRRHRLRRLLPTGAILVTAIIVAVVAGDGGHPRLPKAPVLGPGRPGDPFAYRPGRSAEFIARASAGNAHVLFTKSPGGVLATAARVAGFGAAIDRAAAGTGIDPRLLEAIVFLESAGDPEAIAGADPANAAGLTQIVASTGQSLLGMPIDLAASRRLSAQIRAAGAAGQADRVRRLQAARARVDPRFDPGQALAATVRYLEIARDHFGRPDLAVESYHMGIGNLQSVLGAYDGGAPVPYVQLYFDTAPEHHPAAYQLLSSFGDDSWTYYWRVLAAQQIMSLYRGDRPALQRLTMLQTDSDSAAEVLHPPDLTPQFATPASLYDGYSARTIAPFPSDPAALGLAYGPGFAYLGHRLGVPAAVYRGLRPQALALLVELAASVRSMAGGASPLTVTGAVLDRQAQQLLGIDDPPAAAGWSFTIARTYVDEAQRAALQAMLDRLTSLNLIAWQRYPSEIEITVAADAPRVIASGP